ncbi:MAG TPA: hypothetical protein VLD16_14145 [Gaiellaceae bacterium]|nr:hypothetical protein [Gaiellaceae bacterium]
MATVELQPVAPTSLLSPPRRGHAYGVVLESAAFFPGLQAVEQPLPKRLTAWRETSAEEIDGAWPVAEGRLLHERRHPDGRLFLRVDSREGVGYRIWAPYYGRHLVSPDGGSVESALPRVPFARWQRLFFGEALPLAACLQGLHLLRSSAVAIDGRVVAFVGPRDSGKTAFVAHLVALGAEFVSDDALALELTPAGLVAHPGPTRLSIERAELERVPSMRRGRVGDCIGRSDKLILEPAPIAGPLPLGRIYVLRPGSAVERVAITPARPEPLELLLGATAVAYLRAPRVLRLQLEVCSALAETIPIDDVDLPGSCRAGEVAAEVFAHCAGPTGKTR